ncbi:DUF1731 domain-containing protein [bacterium]|nr:DUF1731 domain-containing protein [bacterium]
MSCLVLDSQRVFPKVLINEGYFFKVTQLDEALKGKENGYA